MSFFWLTVLKPGTEDNAGAVLSAGIVFDG